MAIALHDWIPRVIQIVKPWMSKVDIDKGARWSSEVSTKLKDIRFGLICLTPDNLEAPWILFEAGALSKTLDSTYVCPFLLGIKPKDVKGPLSQFQATVAEKEDIKRLMYAINHAVNDFLSEESLNKAFDVWWPVLESRLEIINSTILENSVTNANHPETYSRSIEAIKNFVAELKEIGIFENQ